MNKRIGIIGGGQLGLMIAEEAHRQGLSVSVLDPSADAPAFAEADAHITASFDDIEALERLGDMSDVLTYEFENVRGDILRHIEGKYNIPQGIAPLFDSQDRLREKNNAARGGLPVPKYIPLPASSADEDCAEVPPVCDNGSLRQMTEEQRIAELRRAVTKIGMPCVLKTRRSGYDGHGQAVIRDEDSLLNAASLLEVPCILEQFIPFDYECSVIMVRDTDKTIHFPVGHNIHSHGILDLCEIPSRGLYDADGRETPLCKRIISACEGFMKKCGYKGILAIELFVKGDTFIFNEMAPRPHNSGHYTIEGCTTSQYRELCRFLTGKPLQEPKLKASTVMKNILGRDLDNAWSIVRKAHESGADVSDNSKRDCAYNGEAGKGVYVHIYGKTVSRPLRKMGHITFTPMDMDEYKARWQQRFTDNI